MTNVSKIGQTQSTQESQPVKPKMKAYKRIDIREGMKVADAKAHGSAMQKIFSDLFDFGNENLENEPDGIYQDFEAETFNSLRFSLDEHELRVYNTDTECKVTIKFDQLSDLSKDKKTLLEALTIGNKYENGEIVIDYSNKAATFDDVSSNEIELSNRALQPCDDIKIRNCNTESISAGDFYGRGTSFSGKKINIINTKDVGVLWDSPVSVQYYKDDVPVIKYDSNSKVDLYPRDREE